MSSDNDERTPAPAPKAKSTAKRTAAPASAQSETLAPAKAAKPAAAPYQTETEPTVQAKPAAKKAKPTTKASPAKAPVSAATSAQPEAPTPPSKPAAKAKATPSANPAAAKKPASQSTKTPATAMSKAEPAVQTERNQPLRAVKPAVKQPPAGSSKPAASASQKPHPATQATPAKARSQAAATKPAPSAAIIEKPGTIAQDTPIATTIALPNQTEETPALAKPAKKRPRRKPLPPALERLKQKLPHYVQLMRLDKPIGILLLFWPTLWALWLAAKGIPSVKNLVIFTLGVLVMRSAGCVINDFADRKIDGRVARTQGRPLATGALTSREAIVLFIALCLIAFGLVLLTDPLTIKLSLGGLALAFCYPFMKRHTHLPQVVLGAAFAWGVPMAYAAQTGKLDKNMWLIYLAVVLWTVVYDTFYAMVDREDDLKIGVKSTAILFGEQDRVITGALQLMVLYALVLVGKAYALHWFFYLSLVVVAGLFGYQQWLIRFRERSACFKAFLNNNWVGAAIFVGILGDFTLK